MSAKNERRKRKFMLTKRGNGKGGVEGEKEADQKKALKVIQVPFRGETRPFKFLPGEYALPAILSLLSLDDPRVNTILNGFGIQVTDATGKRVFPEQPTIYPGEVQVPIDNVPSEIPSKVEDSVSEAQIDVSGAKPEASETEAKVEKVLPEKLDSKDVS